MVVTPKFTFIHLHKSAGTFVNNFIARFFYEKKIIGYHLPARFIPKEYYYIPIIGCVRNPWDFYVSWYSFQLQKQQSSPLFLAVSDNKRRDFNSTMDRLLGLSENMELTQEISGKLPREFGNSGMNIPGPVFAKIYGSGVGLYSFLYQWMYFDAHAGPSILKIEDFPATLDKMLRNLGCEVSLEMQEYLKNAVPANKSYHLHYSEYYDDEIVARVKNLDKLIIDCHNYSFM